MTDPSEARRAAEQRARREHILRAAEAVFGRRPFDEASMQEIARAAGIGMNGLYALFPSKQQLFEEVSGTRLDEILGRLAGSPPGADPLECLRGLALIYAGFFLERPQFFPLWASGRVTTAWGQRSRFSEALDRRAAAVDDAIARVVEAAVAAGHLEPLPTRLLVDVVVGSFSAVVQEALRSGGKDPGPCAERMIEVLLHGVGRRRPPGA